MSRSATGSVFTAPVNSTMQGDHDDDDVANEQTHDELDEKESASNLDTFEEDEFTLSDGTENLLSIKYNKSTRRRTRHDQSSDEDQEEVGYEMTNISKMSLVTARKASDFQDLFGNFIRGGYKTKPNKDNDDDDDNTVETSSSASSSSNASSLTTTTRKLKILERLCASSIRLDDEDGDEAVQEERPRATLKKQDLELIKEELNSIHSKLMVSQFRFVLGPISKLG